MPLSTVQRAELERILERDRARLVRRLQQFGDGLEDFALGAWSQHMAEAAAALTERETAYLLASEEGRRLTAVDRALYRLVHEPERFGVCEACGGDITYERLEAVPHTRACIRCQREAEEPGSGRRE